jgi:Domain of unknown function (DUF4145)
VDFIQPEFLVEAFHCPLCSTYAHMQWVQLRDNKLPVRYSEATCSRCGDASLWRHTIPALPPILGGEQAKDGTMIYPDNGSVPLPEKDMPEDVKRDYTEAAMIFSRSPRGAAALLRLGLQKLCKHLGEEGKNINDDIRELSRKNILPPQLIQVADTVRITGNNAVHPGEMSDEDFDYVAGKMFGLLNFMIKKAISEPKELEALYQLTPEAPRKSAELKDAKSRKSVK